MCLTLVTSGSHLVDFTTILTGLLVIIYWYLTSTFTYWEKRRVHFLQPTPLFGNLKKFMMMKEPYADTIQRLYTELDGVKFGGIFEMRTPALLVRDPEIIKLVLIKDFNHFTDHRVSIDEKTEPLVGKSVFNLKGQRWKEMRSILTPVFTSSKMKWMFSLMCECGQQFEDFVGTCARDGTLVETKDVTGRYALNCIASTAFGVKIDALDNPKSDFADYSAALLQSDGLRFFVFLGYIFAPKLMDKLNIALVPKHISNFFNSLIMDTIKYREENSVTRNDFLQLMMQSKKKRLEDDDKSESKIFQQSKSVLTDADIVSQAVTFIAAGYDSTCTALSFAVYELAVNAEIQTQAREQILQALNNHNGECSYQAVQEMDYLDRVINETMRKWPSIVTADRLCTSRYQMPDSDVIIEPGTLIEIPIYAIHHDPQYYPTPDKFDPDRFTEEAIKQRPSCSFLPFGAGQRNCIGLRFAMLMAKVALVYLLRRHEVLVCEKTQIPVVLKKNDFNVNGEKGLWVKISSL